jgi:hypothetical protein
MNRGAISKRIRTGVLTTALSVCCAAALPGLAQASTVASIRPSFFPDRLGASAAFTFDIKFVNDQGGVPAPLSKSVVHLPAGMRIDTRGVSTCSKARLQRHGAGACPLKALLGSGQAILEVHPASRTLSEEATLWAFRGPNQGGRPVIEILGQGYTPLDERMVITGVLKPDHSPYGEQLAMSIPPIPTLVGEPNASTSSFSLTIGAGRGRAHAAGITVPHSCPTTGFPFAADFTFADGSSTSSTAGASCP